MVEEREQQSGGGPGGDAEGIEAAARMGADLAAQAHRDEGRDEDGPSAREVLYAEVVGPSRTDHFLARFRTFDAQDGAWRFTWSWPALFFPVLWLLYRKMYAWAAALILVQLVLMPTVAASPGVSLILTTAFVVGVPASANWLYYRHVGKVIARSREAGATDAERSAWRKARGGVSWVGPAVLMVVSLIAALWAVSGGTPGI